jgi:6-phosphofructokinase 2
LEYHFVPEGPFIAADELSRFRNLLLDINTEWLVASGSLRPEVPADFYAQIAEFATSRGQKFVLDTSGGALRSAVGRGIDLLKLSLSEFQFLVGKEISDPIEQEQEARALMPHLIAVCLGAAGAILATDTPVFRYPGVEVKAESAVGAGDSFLAALVIGLARQMAFNDALAFGVAAGTASILRRGTAVVNRHVVDQLMSRRFLDEERRSKK